MNIRNILTISAVLLAAPLGFIARSNAGVVGFPSQEYTSLAQQVIMGNQLSQQIQQLAQTFQQLQEMIYQAKNMVTHPVSDIVGDLSQLASVVSQAGGLSYSMGNLQSQFTQQYPGYNPQTNWTQQYASWNQNTLNTIIGSLKAVGLQGQQLNSEQSIMSALRGMLASPQSETQAIQAGATISQELVGQMAKFRQLQIADLQSKAAYTGYQLNLDNARQQADAYKVGNNPEYSGDGVKW